MYPSDYGYSALASSCARTTDLGSYVGAKCAGASWLYGNGSEWTLTHRTDTRNVFDCSYNLFYYNPESSFAFRPVLYLDASVYKIDGDGSLENPYIIGM